MVSKELKDLYDYTQIVIEKYKDTPDDQIYDLVSDEEMIALIFNVYLNEVWNKEQRAQNLIKNMLIYQFHNVEGGKGDLTEIQNKMLRFISLLLQNDPSLYSQLVRAFWKLREEPNGISDRDLCQCKEKVDKLQVAIKEKEYKTPFYNVAETEEEYNKSFGEDPQFKEGENI